MIIYYAAKDIPEKNILKNDLVAFSGPLNYKDNDDKYLKVEVDDSEMEKVKNEFMSNNRWFTVDIKTKKVNRKSDAEIQSINNTIKNKADKAIGERIKEKLEIAGYKIIKE